MSEPLDDKDDKLRAEELLPWYLTGNLSAEETAFVDRALKTYPELEQEIEFLNLVQDKVRERESVSPPGEFGLARLKRDMRASQDLSTSEMKDDTAEEVTPIGSRRRQILAIAACLLVALFVGYQSAKLPIGGTDLAGSDSRFAGPVIQVTFKASATETQIRGLLRELDLQIVSGPSALGLYRLQGVEKGGNTDALLVRLRAAAGIVESAGLD